MDMDGLDREQTHRDWYEHVQCGLNVGSGEVVVLSKQEGKDNKF